MAKKIKSGRELAIEMLNMTLKYDQANAQEAWVSGMCISWANKLVEASITKKDAKLNKKELSEDVKEMIQKYIMKRPETRSRELLIESCVNFCLFPTPKPKKKRR